MNIYNLLRILSNRKLPAPLKLLGLWGMHISGRRMTGVFIDPAMGCNLRCRMCYFSDEASRRKMHGTISEPMIDRVEHAMFHRAMKLQIGCGAEPTLYPNLAQLIERGHNAGIPYISLTTNGMLIASGKVELTGLINAGLTELTLSMHGTSKHTYEYLMPGADFSNLQKLTVMLSDAKKMYPEFKIRVNFTVNSMNINDLHPERFWSLWSEGVKPDIIQLRPVQNLGASAWTDFDLTPLIENYDATIGAIAADCRRLGITCVAPDADAILATAGKQEGASALIEDITYCYVSPDTLYKSDFLPDDTYESYHARHKTGLKLLKAVFTGAKSRDKKRTKKFNYRIN